MNQIIETAVRNFMSEFYKQIENEQIDPIIDENFIKNYSIFHQSQQSTVEFIIDVDLFQYKSQLIIPHEEPLWTTNISFQYELLENALHQEQEIQKETFSPQEMKLKNILDSSEFDEGLLQSNNAAVVRALLSNALYFFIQHKKSLLEEVMEGEEDGTEEYL